MKLPSRAMCGPPKMDGSRWKVLTKSGPLEKGNGISTSAFLPAETHEQYEKAERDMTLKDEYHELMKDEPIGC